MSAENILIKMAKRELLLQDDTTTTHRNTYTAAWMVSLADWLHDCQQ